MLQLNAAIDTFAFTWSGFTVGNPAELSLFWRDPQGACALMLPISTHQGAWRPGRAEGCFGERAKTRA